MEADKAFDLTLEKLKRLFQEGKASAHDVDQNGNTLLHKVCDVLGQVTGRWRARVPRAFYRNYLNFFWELYALGIDLNASNVAGLTYLNKIVTYHMNVYHGPKRTHVAWTSYVAEEVTTVVAKILGNGGEFLETPLESLPRDFAFVKEDLVQEMMKFPDLAEAFRCGNISRAVLLRLETSLRNAIAIDRVSLNESNTFGQTPLHLSVGWPAGIRVLLDAGADIESADVRGDRPISYAMSMNHVESISLLGEAQCELYILRTGIPDILASAIAFGGSLEYSHIADAVIRLAVQRRKQLQGMVLATVLPSSLDERLLRTDRILDEYANLACSILQNHDIPIPPHLLPPPNHHTAYHNARLTHWVAESLWQAGFRDIDGSDEYGRTPLMISPMMTYRRSFENYLKLVGWFLVKGASLYSTQACRLRLATDTDDRDLVVVDINVTGSNIQAIHYTTRIISSFIFRDLLPEHPVTPCLQMLRKRLLELDVESSILLKNVIMDPVQDSCSCFCSSGGCSALSVFLKRFGADNRLREHLSVDGLQTLHKWTFLTVECILDFLLNFIGATDPMWQWISVELIRAFTFEELGLRHTCCQWQCGKVVEYEDSTDIFEIHDGYGHKIAFFEEIMLEFESKQSELSLPIQTFLKGYWRERMDEVLHEQDVVDEEELQRLGISLQERRFPVEPPVIQEGPSGYIDQRSHRNWNWIRWDIGIDRSEPSQETQIEVARTMVEGMQQDISGEPLMELTTRHER